MRDEVPDSTDPGRAWADRAQRAFVFEWWAPGAERLTLRELACRACGLVVYAPRPSGRDLARKYEVLMAAGVRLGSASDLDRDRGRARAVAELVHRHAPDARSVLDVGGGDGRLLWPFLEAGLSASLVDHHPDPRPGVQRLGATVDDLPPGARFDAVLMNHVLEHVSDPGALIRRCADLTEGVLVAEVPVELWRGTPVGVDPVTHVNHFVGASLRELMRRNGWVVLESFEGWGRYDGHPLEIARVAATPGSRPQEREDARAAVERRLRPAPADRLRRRLARWRLAPLSA